MTPETILQTAANGVLLGLIYTVVTLGLSLTMGVLGLVNVAHSAFLIFGALVAWELVNVAGLNPAIAALVILPTFFLGGWFVERIMARPVARDPDTGGLLLLFGVMVTVESIALVIWTTDPRTLRLGPLAGSVALGPLSLPEARLAAAGLGLVAAALLHLFLTRTMSGRATRAMADNVDAAATMGIDTARLSRFVFGLGTALAGLGGVALALAFTFSPQEHVRWLAWAFLIVVVGGLGSVPATVAAALAVGLLEAFVGLVLPFQYVYLIIYGLLALVLLLRPYGLLGVAERRV
jgi:branched-chain amino acid transport system permease protein